LLIAPLIGKLQSESMDLRKTPNRTKRKNKITFLKLSSGLAESPACSVHGTPHTSVNVELSND